MNILLVGSVTSLWFLNFPPYKSMTKSKTRSLARAIDWNRCRFHWFCSAWPACCVAGAIRSEDWTAKLSWLQVKSLLYGQTNDYGCSAHAYLTTSTLCKEYSSLKRQLWPLNWKTMHAFSFQGQTTGSVKRPRRTCLAGAHTLTCCAG